MDEFFSLDLHSKYSVGVGSKYSDEWERERDDAEVGREHSWDKRAEGRRISGTSLSASPLETHAVSVEQRAPSRRMDGWRKISWWERNSLSRRNSDLPPPKFEGKEKKGERKGSSLSPHGR